MVEVIKMAPIENAGEIFDNTQYLRSELEINLMRLLHKTEQRALNASAEVATDWRQGKYIACLKEMATHLEKSVQKPSNEDLSIYNKRIHLLENSFDTLLKSLDNNKKDKEFDLCGKSGKNDNRLSREDEPLNEISHLNDQKPENSNVGNFSKPVPSEPSRIGHIELQAKTNVQPLKEMRNELLGSQWDENDVRLRKKPNTNDDDVLDDETVEAILSRHNAMQERVAEEMLQLAKNLKQTTLSAGEFIRRDEHVLDKANECAANNYDKLARETERVSNTKPLGCQWWLFILLGIVCLLFMWVVLLIRIT